MSSNQVMTFDSGRTVVVKNSQIDFTRVRADVRDICNVMSTIRHLVGNRCNPKGDLEVLSDALDRARALLPTMPATLTNLRAGMDAPSKATITKAVAILVGCFPNAEGKDLTVYGRVLVDDLAEMKFSMIRIDGAFVRLRRTLKFLPSISEVLEAVREVPEFVSELDRCNRLAEQIEDGEATKLRLEQDLARPVQSQNSPDRAG